MRLRLRCVVDGRKQTAAANVQASAADGVETVWDVVQALTHAALAGQLARHVSSYPVRLSLNGRDVLCTVASAEDRDALTTTLSGELGISGGDLLYCLPPSEPADGLGQDTAGAGAAAAAPAPAAISPVRDGAMAASVSRLSIDARRAAGSVEGALTPRLLSSAALSSTAGRAVFESDALCVAVHAVFLDCGFQSTPSQPGDVCEAMPPTFRGTGMGSGVYILTYQPPVQTRRRSLTVKAVTMGPALLILSAAIRPAPSGASASPVFSCHLKPADYVQPTASQASDPQSVFQDLRQLSVSVKDKIVNPVLDALRAELGIAPLASLATLPPELKLHLFTFLTGPREVCALSAVNAEFNAMSLVPSLWKTLLRLHFPDRRGHHQRDWRQAYVSAHQHRTSRRRAANWRPAAAPRLGFPPGGFRGPAGLPGRALPIVGGDYDMGPVVGGVPPGHGGLFAPPGMGGNPFPAPGSLGGGFGRGGGPFQSPFSPAAQGGFGGADPFGRARPRGGGSSSRWRSELQ